MQVRWEVTDGEGVTIGNIRGSGGAILFDSAARIKRVVRGVRFHPDDWQDINPFADWFRPVVTGSDGVARPMGWFTATSVPLRWRNIGDHEPVEPYLMDAGFFLYQDSPEPLTAMAGDRLSRVLERAARDAGITRVVNQACGERCGQAMVVPPGSSPGVFMEGVALLAGFAPPWFDRYGVLRLGPRPELSGTPDAVYQATDVVRFSRVTNQNLLEAPNVFVVQGSDATFEAVRGVAEVPGSAPNSVANRGGRRVVRVVQEQGLLSSSQAQRVANSLAATSVEQYETVSFRSLVDTNHDGFGVVVYDGVPYRERFWSLELDGVERGVMAHELQRGDVDRGF